MSKKTSSINTVNIVYIDEISSSRTSALKKAEIMVDLEDSFIDDKHNKNMITKLWYFNVAMRELYILISKNDQEILKKKNQVISVVNLNRLNFNKLPNDVADIKNIIFCENYSEKCFKRAFELIDTEYEHSKPYKFIVGRVIFDDVQYYILPSKFNIKKQITF